MSQTGSEKQEKIAKSLKNPHQNVCSAIDEQ
jgi:hypothetical protein